MTGSAGAVHVVSASSAADRSDTPIVVLIHGAMDRAASFGRVVRLVDDLSVVRYDRRGYGKSTDLGIGDLATHVDDLLDVVAARPAVLVGHSIGGVIALVAAQREPALVLSVAAWEAPMPWAPWWPAFSAGGAALAAMPDDAAADGDGDGDGDGDRPPSADEAAADAAERFMRRIVGATRWQRLPPSTRAARRAEGRALLADLASLRGDHAPYDAASLTQAVLAGHGTESVPYHQRAARELAAAAPRGELVVVADSSHGVHLSHPADFAAFIHRAVALSGPE